ncbi:hypothetical protein AAC387_Pa04g2045 [Persea americana]
MLIGNGKVLRRYSDTHTELPLPAWAVNSHYPVFLHYERNKGGNCSFTAALVGGILDFPVFLRSEWRKAGNCRFTAAPIGGKVDFPFFLRSERRKTGISIFAAGTCGGNLSIRSFILFSHLLLVGGSWVGAHFHKMKDGDVRITIG